jgi:hypothetical protein
MRTKLTRGLLCLFALVPSIAYPALPPSQDHQQPSREPVRIDTAQLDTICARIRVLPISDSMFRRERREAESLLGAQTFGDLKTLTTISDAQLQSLMESSDARKRSVAVFVAWQRGDSKRLLSLARRYAACADAAVPAASLSAASGEAPARAQTLGSYIDTVFHAWFGLPAIAEPDEFDKMFPGSPSFVDSDTWVYPWVNRLRRAKYSGDADEQKRVAAEVRKLPDLNRAVIVSIRFMEDGTPPTHADWIDLLGPISPEALESLSGTAKFLPRDPLLARENGEIRKSVVAAFDQLMQSAPKGAR